MKEEPLYSQFVTAKLAYYYMKLGWKECANSLNDLIDIKNIPAEKMPLPTQSCKDLAYKICEEELAKPNREKTDVEFYEMFRRMADMDMPSTQEMLIMAAIKAKNKSTE